MTNDPTNPDYNPKARDAIMDLCPFYDPNHKCGIVREHVFKDCLTELRERERLALESARRLDALSSAGMAKILRLEKKQAEWRETARIFFAKDEEGFHHRAEIFQHCANELRELLSQNASDQATAS